MNQYDKKVDNDDNNEDIIRYFDLYLRDNCTKGVQGKANTEE